MQVEYAPLRQDFNEGLTQSVFSDRLLDPIRAFQYSV